MNYYLLFLLGAVCGVAVLILLAVICIAYLAVKSDNSDCEYPHCACDGRCNVYGTKFQNPTIKQDDKIRTHASHARRSIGRAVKEN
jgi:hypothetical protein